MTTALTDIGVNLLHPQLADDIELVIQRAHESGVSRMLVTATNLDEAAAAIALCQQRGPGLWCTAGVHPHDAKDASGAWEARLAELASHDSVKAIGETGLDFYRNFSPPDVQVAVFRAQLTIAAATEKPVFVHDRDSNGKVGELLDEQAGSLRGVVVHCFTGSREELTRYLDAGYYIGITGWLCDKKRGAMLRELATLIPLDRLLVESDAPFLRPHNAPRPATATHRRRNEPALLPYVVAQLAELHGCDPEDIAAATHRNAETLFQLAH